jgi:predicted DNA-binding protein YlxM (UPF0122 family)
VKTLSLDKLSKNVGSSELLDTYGTLLTKRQSEILELHAEQDLSYSEIAELSGISVPAVSDMVARTEKKLYSYEENLGFAEKTRRLRALSDELLRGGNAAAAQAILDILELPQS